MILAACALSTILNLSMEPINDRDLQEKEAASKRCFYIYPEAPCLKQFIKVRPLIYRAICMEASK